jgi:hypothetical protein
MHGQKRSRDKHHEGVLCVKRRGELVYSVDILSIDFHIVDGLHNSRNRRNQRVRPLGWIPQGIERVCDRPNRSTCSRLERRCGEDQAGQKNESVEKDRSKESGLFDTARHLLALSFFCPMLRAGFDWNGQDTICAASLLSPHPGLGPIVLRVTGPVGPG